MLGAGGDLLFELSVQDFQILDHLVESMPEDLDLIISMRVDSPAEISSLNLIHGENEFTHSGRHTDGQHARVDKANHHGDSGDGEQLPLQASD